MEGRNLTSRRIEEQIERIVMGTKYLSNGITWGTHRVHCEFVDGLRVLVGGQIRCVIGHNDTAQLIPDRFHPEPVCKLRRRGKEGLLNTYKMHFKITYIKMIYKECKLITQSGLPVALLLSPGLYVLKKIFVKMQSDVCHNNFCQFSSDYYNVFACYDISLFRV